MHRALSHHHNRRPKRETPVRVLRNLLAAAAWFSLASAFSHASSSSPTLALYSRSFVTKHYYSSWSGAVWSTATQYNTGPDESIWMATANCPTRNDIAIATLDYSQNVRTYFYSSGVFTSSALATASTGGYGQRRFDLAYEQVSGDLLLAYWDNATSQIGYRTSTGTTLSAQSLFALTSSASVQFLTLVPRPGGNEIALLCGNSLGYLYGTLWTGSGWYYVGALSTSLAAPTKECFAVNWQRTSGSALVVFGASGAAQPHYYTYTAGALSAEMAMTGIGSAPQWVRLASNPTNNTVVCAMVNGSGALYACVWNGSSWGTMTQLCSNVGSTAERRFDVCYEPGGAKALIAYSDNSNVLKYRTWNGATWSSQQSGPDFGGIINIVQLKPCASGTNIVGLCSDDDWQLNVLAWDGSAMIGSTMINDPLGGEAYCEAFSVVAGGTAAKKRIGSWKQSAPP